MPRQLRNFSGLNEGSAALGGGIGAILNAIARSKGAGAITPIQQSSQDGEISTSGFKPSTSGSKFWDLLARPNSDLIAKLNAQLALQNEEARGRGENIREEGKIKGGLLDKEYGLKGSLASNEFDLQTILNDQMAKISTEKARLDQLLAIGKTMGGLTDDQVAKVKAAVGATEEDTARKRILRENTYMDDPEMTNAEARGRRASLLAPEAELYSKSQIKAGNEDVLTNS